MDWNTLRETEFPVAKRWAYFDHAAVSPLPRRSGDALRAWIDEQESNGCVNWPSWERKLESFRALIAQMLNAHPDEIAYVNSTTQGIGLVAEGFPWREGDNVVTAEDEYPSNIYPWLNLAQRGVTLRTVPTREGRIWPEDIAAACDHRTRVITISHVEWASGFRNDLDTLAELAHARGAALFVDAIQGLGPHTIDLARTPVDFLAADGHKWLLGPEGAGLLFVRREWIDRLRPLGVGWHSVRTSFQVPGIHFDLKTTAQRWEGGSFNMPGIQAFGASIELMMEIGPESVSERILERAAAVREIAARRGWQIIGSKRAEDLSGIVCLQKDGVDPDTFARELRRKGIALSSRRGRLRISPHIYNNQEDLDRLERALQLA